MTGSLTIFSHSANHTTARYFERAAAGRSTGKIRYVSRAQDLFGLGPDDVLFIVDPMEDWLVGLEDLPCRKVAYLIDVHSTYELRVDLGRWCDLVFVSHRRFVQRLKDSGFPHVVWLPVAADPEMHHVPGLERIFDVGFVGKLGSYGSYRFDTLNRILPKFSTNDYRRWHEPDEMGRIYSQSKIVVNASTNDDLTMRVFEALCSGALLVTDRADGLDALFVEGEHYVGYSSPEEAVEKIRYYLDNPAERLRIAEAGRQALLSGHTYAHRLRYVEEVIAAGGWWGSAPVNTYSARQLAAVHARIFMALRSPRGVLAVMRRYGMSLELIRVFLCTCGALINSIIPVTPNAIAVKLGLARARAASNKVR